MTSQFDLYKQECEENDEPICVDTQHHLWEIDDTTQTRYCSKCGCLEY